MVKLNNLVGGFLLILLLFSCDKKDNQISVNSLESQNENIYEDASKVPVGKLGVFIVIDSLGIFENGSDNFTNNPDNDILKELTLLNNQEEIEKYIQKRANNILTDQKKNFEFIKLDSSIKTKEIFKPDFDASKHSSVFDKLPYDDFLVVAIRSGLNFDTEKKLDGKTNIYISIIDKKNLKSKYFETLNGNKYLESKDFASNSDYYKNLIRQSVEYTFDIIDIKY